MAAKRQRTTSSTAYEFKYQVEIQDSCMVGTSDAPTHIEKTGTISLEGNPKVWMLLIRLPHYAFYMKSTGEIVDNGDMRLSELKETSFICRPYPPSQAYLQKKVTTHFYVAELSKVCDELSCLTMQIIEKEHRRDEIFKRLNEVL